MKYLPSGYRSLRTQWASSPGSRDNEVIQVWYVPLHRINFLSPNDVPVPQMRVTFWGILKADPENKPKERVAIWSGIPRSGGMKQS